MITVLVLTLACCVLERSTNKSLLWTQNAVSSLTSVQAHSKQISVCQEIVTSFRSRKPSGLYRAIFPSCTFSENSSLVRENLSSQTQSERVHRLLALLSYAVFNTLQKRQ